MAFGDLFLEDIREYRENQLLGTGIEPLFPLWKIPTGVLAEQMLSAGIEAYISCLDPGKVPPSLAGRRWSKDLINELPEDVDPCGENGEFHTIVVDGPGFERPIRVTVGESVEREGFLYTDVIPAGMEE